MDDHSRRTRVLAAVLFAVAAAGLATAVVIALVAGLSWADAVGNPEIARRMSIAPKTVANHVAAIFTKLQVADRSQAIVVARDAGLGRDV